MLYGIELLILTIPQHREEERLMPRRELELPVGCLLEETDRHKESANRLREPSREDPIGWQLGRKLERQRRVLLEAGERVKRAPRSPRSFRLSIFSPFCQICPERDSFRRSEWQTHPYLSHAEYLSNRERKSCKILKSKSNYLPENWVLCISWFLIM